MDIKKRLGEIEKKLERIDFEQTSLSVVVLEDHSGRKIQCRTPDEIWTTLQQIILDEI